MYTKTAENALASYAAFTAGDPNDIACCISFEPLPRLARQAIENSLEKLDYGKNRCTWITVLANSAAATPEQTADQTRIAATQNDASSCTTQAVDHAGDQAVDQLSETQLLELLESMDPLVIIATDTASTCLLTAAYGQSVQPNQLTRLWGRSAIAFEDFSHMLLTDQGKQSAWHVLKMLARA